METHLEVSKPFNRKDEIYSVLLGHRSIRVYDDRPIPEETLERMLGAATRASSSGNMQAYSIIVTTDQTLKGKAFEPHFRQPMVLKAPALLTFCADFRRMRKWLLFNEAPDGFDNFMSFMIATIDATLASQNAAIAAEAEGLGICYLGSTLASCKEIAEILHCPPGVVPVVGFSIGYPKEQPEDRGRLPMNAIVHREVYNDKSAEEIQELYKQKEEQGLRRYLKDPTLKALLEKSGSKNLAQIYTKLKYTRESHIKYSQCVMDCLQQQGFMPP